MAFIIKHSQKLFKVGKGGIWVGWLDRELGARWDSKQGYEKDWRLDKKGPEWDWKAD